MRQSIIHVEQDDIDFDEEELAGERDRAADAAQAAAAAGTDDVEMAGVETSDQPIDESYNESGVLSTQAVHGGIHTLTSSPTRAGGSGAQLVGTPVPRPAAVPRRKMKITHDKYAKMQQLIVYHLQEAETRTGHGIDRDELIDRYLESMEDELQTVEDLEYEKELFGKVLRKLVKVCLVSVSSDRITDVPYQDSFLLEIKGDVQESLPSMEEDSQRASEQDDANMRVYYMVHPSVDADTTSSYS